MALVRIKDKYQVTIPTKLRERARLSVGDYLEATLDKRGVITLTPKDFVDRGVAEGLEDLREGRIHGPFETVEGMLESLQGRPPAAKKRAR